VVKHKMHSRHIRYIGVMTNSSKILTNCTIISTIHLCEDNIYSYIQIYMYMHLHIGCVPVSESCSLYFLKSFSNKLFLYNLDKPRKIVVKKCIYITKR